MIVELDCLFSLPAGRSSGVKSIIGGVAGATGKVSNLVPPRDTWMSVDGSTVVAIIVMTLNSSGGTQTPGGNGSTRLETEENIYEEHFCPEDLSLEKHENTDTKVAPNKTQLMLNQDTLFLVRIVCNRTPS